MDTRNTNGNRLMNQNGTAKSKEQQSDNRVIKLYRKYIEISLSTNKKEYNLDKWQSLNGKALNRIMVPNFFGPYNNNPAGTGALVGYVNSPLTPSGLAIITAPEAIDGAYLKLINQQNQAVDDLVPLQFFRADNYYFADKMFYADTPYIDWTQSKIIYPDATIPGAQNGKSFYLIAEYFDVVYEENLTFSTV